MSRWKAMVALLLALLYLPATGHCLLEQVGLLSSGGDCCEQRASTADTQSIPCPYGCCPTEYAVYFSPAPVHAAAPALIAEVPVCVTLVVPASSITEPQLASPDTSPPELPKVWQFFYRTALPPRAPSFVS